MKPGKNRPAAPRRPTGPLTAQALNEAAREAVEVHLQAGLPLAVWENGKVVLVPAHKIKATGNGNKTRRRKR